MSDVFDEYVKIMTNKGFVKEADVITRVDKEKDSEYAETIKALYGLDIKTNNSNKDIVEQAHPERVVVAPSYDRLNGLVENLNERSDIMKGIAMKPTHGNLTQHRYAEKELLDELIRLGFSLDLDGNEELSKIADDCAVKLAEQEEGKLKKEAILGWVTKALPFVIKYGPKILKALGIAAAFGYVRNKAITNISQGIKPDAELALQRLENLEQHISDRYKAKLREWKSRLQFVIRHSEKAEQILGRDGGDVDIISISDENQAKRAIQRTQSDNKYLAQFDKVVMWLINNIGNRSLDPTGLTGQSSGFVNEIANMDLETEAPQSPLYTEVERMVGESTFNVRDEAVKALLTLKRSLKKFHSDLVEDSGKAVEMGNKQGMDLFQQFQQIGSQQSATATDLEGFTPEVE